MEKVDLDAKLEKLKVAYEGYNKLGELEGWDNNEYYERDHETLYELFLDRADKLENMLNDFFS